MVHNTYLYKGGLVGISMKTEFNLSEKMIRIRESDSEVGGTAIYKHNIKEFIKRLKEYIKTNEFFHSRTSTRLRLYKIIDKLAGDKLI